MPRTQQSVHGRWQVSWRSLQMQAARATQTGQSQRILIALREGHHVCFAAMLQAPCLHKTLYSEEPKSLAAASCAQGWRQPAPLQLWGNAAPQWPVKTASSHSMPVSFNLRHRCLLSRSG